MHKILKTVAVLPALYWGAASAAIDSGAVNLPADDKVLYILGQDTSTLRDYKNQVGTSAPVPGGVTLYSSLLPVEVNANSAPADASLYVSGIEGPPVDNSNGEVDFAETLADYDQLAGGDSVALAVGLYLSDEWADCGNQPLRAIAGTGDSDVGSASDPQSLTSQYRYAIDRMLNYFKNDGRPVYLRIGYEFDGPWNCYNQDFYKQAYRWIADRIDTLGANNVATVWQAATYPDNGDSAYDFDAGNNPYQHYSDWYPGDDAVDWVGLSFFAGSEYLAYQWSCQDGSKPWTVPDISPRALQDTLVQFASDRGKPAMIAESAPQGFDMAAKTYSCTASRTNTQSFASSQAMWDAYFVDYFNWIEQNADQVRAFAYINTDWQSQGRWYCAPGASACASGYWGVTSLQADTVVLNNFAAEVSGSLYATAGSAVGGGHTGGGDGGSGDDGSTNDPEQSAYTSQSIPGRIEVEAFDSGGQGVAYSDTDATNNGGALRPNEAVDLQATSDDAGQNLGWTEDGEWLEYTLDSVVADTYDIDVRLATPNTAGNRALTLSLDGDPLATVDVPQTGDWQNWQTVTVPAVSITGGADRVLRLGIIGGSFNVNWVEFTPVANDGGGDGEPIDPPAGNDCGDFGIAYQDDTTMVLYHADEGWSADWKYLCLDSDCRSATLNNGYYTRAVSGQLGQSYSVEFKVQQTAAPGQFIAGPQTFTFNNACTLP
ncbi:family 31 carbohydrate-binding protein [Gilvimarinus xylanilyticus]|uniref:Family 31 carbohydrate-binding protein n=1 Tax=Gilvimarinus xylanilyticus TaxID=2944139 RepID=A0A9X2I1L6_9GAMM|nr:family 31 carbohydrate-binding protein [Gilvimarinus xylanilyticus]MCP8900969.1 family 31 carbohydrate-binding protein [Gilvimarinus xylanilyticus]